jgi:hypothetical protein
VYISRESKLISLYFIIIFVWGLTFYFLGIKQSLASYWWQFAYGLIPFVGGIVGMVKSKQWGWIHSKLGRALFFISAGTTSWGIGQILWSAYYNLTLQVEVPYPSLADVGYIISIPLWIIGIVNLSRATGVNFSLKHFRGKIILFTVPVLAFIVSYYLLVVVARGGTIPVDGSMLKVFFDFAYPVGDLFILSLSLLVYGLSFNYLGGRYKIPILCIIVGFFIMYFADFSFSYTTTLGTYFNGNIADLLFVLASFVICFGVTNFDTKGT